MSDELAIQPQIQPRKRTNPAAYAIPAAAVGALGTGYYAANHTGTPMSHQDIVNELNDKDKFEARTKDGAKEAKTWRDAQARAEDVKKAEEAVRNAEHAQLPEGDTARTNFEKVQKEYDEAVNELVEKRKAYLEKHGGRTGKANEALRNPKSWAELTNAQRAGLIHEYDGKENKAKNAYEKICKELKNAELDFADRSDIGKLVNQKDRIKMELEDFITNHSSLTSDTVDREVDMAISGRNGWTTRVGRRIIPNLYNDALAKAHIIIPNYPSTIQALDNAQFLEIAEEFASRNDVPKKYVVREIDGVIHAIDPQRFSEHKKEAIKEITAQRETLAIDILEATRNGVKNQSEVANPYEMLRKGKTRIKLDSATLRELGLSKNTVTDDDLKNILENAFEHTAADETPTAKKIVAQAIDTTRPITGTYNFNGYAGDLDLLRKAKNTGSNFSANYAADGTVTIENATKNVKLTLLGNYEKALIKDATGTVTGINIDKAISMAEARKNIASNIIQVRNIAASRKASVQTKGIALYQELMEKLANKRAESTELSELYAKAAEQFPEIFEVTEGGGSLSASEIEAQAKEYAEKNVDRDLRSRFDKFKAEYEKACKERGTVSETAKKEAEEALAKAKGEFEKVVKELGQKFKTGGVNKWLAAAIGAVVLGGATWGSIAASNKNKA